MSSGVKCIVFVGPCVSTKSWLRVRTRIRVRVRVRVRIRVRVRVRVRVVGGSASRVSFFDVSCDHFVTGVVCLDFKTIECLNVPFKRFTCDILHVGCSTWTTRGRFANATNAHN
jgi:hypothetical protein